MVDFLVTTLFVTFVVLGVIGLCMEFWENMS